MNWILQWMSMFLFGGLALIILVFALLVLWEAATNLHHLVGLVRRSFKNADWSKK